MRRFNLPSGLIMVVEPWCGMYEARIEGHKGIRAEGKTEELAVFNLCATMSSMEYAIKNRMMEEARLWRQHSYE